MFYDLNILWRTPDDELKRTVALLDHCTPGPLNSLANVCIVGYSVIAFNVIHTGKLPAAIVHLPIKPSSNSRQIPFPPTRSPNSLKSASSRA